MCQSIIFTDDIFTVSFVVYGRGSDSPAPFYLLFCFEQLMETNTTPKISQVTYFMPEQKYLLTYWQVRKTDFAKFV